MIKPKMRCRIKRELSAKRPTIWIGKNGISREVLAEIDSQLERTEMMKAKILKTALGGNNSKSIATKIAKQTKSVLVEVRGRTFILYRKKREEAPL